MFTNKISQRIGHIAAKSGTKAFTISSLAVVGFAYHNHNNGGGTNSIMKQPSFELFDRMHWLCLVPTAHCDASDTDASLSMISSNISRSGSLRRHLKGLKAATVISEENDGSVDLGTSAEGTLLLPHRPNVMPGTTRGNLISIHVDIHDPELRTWVQYFQDTVQGMSQYIFTVAHDSLWIALRVLYICALFTPSLVTFPALLLIPQVPVDSLLLLPVPSAVNNFIFLTNHASTSTNASLGVEVTGALKLLHGDSASTSASNSTTTNAVAMADHASTHTYTVANYWFALFKSSVRYSGPCIMKFTQWLATRPDILPLSACLELQEIQTNSFCPSKDSSVTILKADLGDDILERLHVNEKDLKIVGNGCVAQVLYGQTWTGEDVALKVIHPYTARNIALDIRIMEYGASIAEAVLPGVHNWSLVDSVAEFSAIMYSQLSMVDEAQRLDRFRSNFDRERLRKISLLKNCNVVFPRPLWPYVTENVLVESFEPGFACSDILAESGDSRQCSGSSSTCGSSKAFGSPENSSAKSKADAEAESLALSGLISSKHLIAELTTNTMLKMIFDDNFVHGDLHPGNILLRYAQPTNSGGKGSNGSPVLEMVILDAGIVSELTGTDKRNLIDLFKAIARNGGEEAGALMIERSAFNAQQLREYYRKQGKNCGSLLDGMPTVCSESGTRNDESLSSLATAGANSTSTSSAATEDINSTCAAAAAAPASKLPGPNTPGIIDPEGFCQEIKALVDEVHAHGLSLGRISIGNILERMLLLCHKHNVKMDAKFIQTMLALGIAEGVIRRLDPEINVLERAIPYIVKAAVVDTMEQKFGGGAGGAGVNGGVSDKSSRR